jgi:hypothetical protein
MAEGDPRTSFNEAAQHPPTLDYRGFQRFRPEMSKGQIILGAILSMVFVMGSVFVGVLFMITSGGNGKMIALIGCTVVGLNVWAVVAHRSINYKGLAMGIWIGFGVAVLLEGLCFGIGSFS